MEKFIERGLFASRWLLAPFYVGLIGTLLALLVTFDAPVFFSDT